MDDLLQPFLHSTNDSERQRHLDELLLLHATPVVRSILQQRLGFHVNQSGTNPYNQDAEDLYQEALTKIIQSLNDLRDSHRTPIQHFRRYVSRTTANTCINYLRSKSPARRRLKDKVRLLLLYHSDFAFWEAEGEFLCGFNAWQGSSPRPLSEVEGRKTEEQLEHALITHSSTQVLMKTPLLETMAELFEFQNGPIELDMLVNVLAKLLRTEDRPVASIDNDFDNDLDPHLVEAAPADLPDFDGLTLLSRLWKEVQRLPRGQRDAYCFRFHDERGEDLFSLLIGNRVASLLQIARALDRSEQEIRRLLSIMPMDGATAAAELNASTAQVHHWRFKALERLMKELLLASR